MTHQDRFMELLTDWLEDQAASAPDQLLDSVIEDLQTTPQRARWMVLLRRIPMFGSNALRYYAVAGAVVLAVVVGLGLWAGQPPSVGPPAVTPAPSPTPVPAPTATAVPSPAPTIQSTDPRQTTVWSMGRPDDSYDFFVGVTFELPARWAPQFRPRDMAGASSPRGFNALLFLTTQVRPFEDPCARPLVPLDVGSSVDDLIDALVGLPVEVSSVAETVIDGYPAKQLTFTELSEGPACEDGSQLTWRWENGHNHGVGPNVVTRLWAVDVDGTRLVIVTVEDDASPQEKAELQQMVDSIRLAPPASD
jgi:hypothetical protein